MSNTEPRFIFFGTPKAAVVVLDELLKKGFKPECVVTAPDRRAGRGQHMSTPQVKVWAEQHNIDVLQPEKLDEEALQNISSYEAECGIVAAYGKIIPQSAINIFPKGILNVHPSLLPRYRGASPVRSQILEGEKHIGTTVMKIDAELDHGPLLSQKEIVPPASPMKGSELTELLFREGGALLGEVLHDYLAGTLVPYEQDHEKATFTKKIQKEDGLIDLSDDPEKNLRKIRAFDDWPRAYFFTDEGKRIIVTEAHIEDGALIIDRVIPEGKKEMEWKSFQKTQ